ncbi:hypothetical protein ACIOD2_00050 [Amycolatopsis sp. NPDC088138]|uniref:hypothetical protein n=1 Tax=Amycolatopsis sp. NPDC088138 TaxID=3363938 RepID=UPI003824FBCB
MPEDVTDVVLTIPAMDGQYHVRTRPGVENDWPGSADGLLVGEDNWVTVLCGTQFGPVDLTVRRHPGRPAEAIAADWDMSAEWSLESARGELLIRDIYSSNDPTIIATPTGWLRLRISVRGRLAASQVQGQINEPVESHLLEAWPVDIREEPLVARGPDELAQYLVG